MEIYVATLNNNQIKIVTELSEKAQLFEKLTSTEYDNYFAYRFVNQYRNYVQHCGKPISSINR